MRRLLVGIVMVASGCTGATATDGPLDKPGEYGWLVPQEPGVSLMMGETTLVARREDGESAAQLLTGITITNVTPTSSPRAWR